MSEGESSPPRRKRRFLLLVFILLTTGVASYLIFWGGLRLWNASLPADAPRIAMTPDDGWIARLGFTALTYDQIFSRAGGRLIKLEVPDEPGALGPAEIRKRLEGMEALLLSGGGDVDPELYGGDPNVAELVNRKRDDFEIALIREARAMKLPILGICRGAQILNVAFGGELIDFDSDEEFRAIHFASKGHPIEVEDGSLLSRLMRPGKIDKVTSYHRQAVGRLGEGVRAVARSPEGTIEAIEVSETEDEWTIAVQWHPEMTVRDELQFALISAFVDEARRRRLPPAAAEPPATVSD